MLGLAAVVTQPLLTTFTSLFCAKCYLLKARVIIYSYKHQ